MQNGKGSVAVCLRAFHPGILKESIMPTGRALRNPHISPGSFQPIPQNSTYANLRAGCLRTRIGPSVNNKCLIPSARTTPPTRPNIENSRCVVLKLTSIRGGGEWIALLVHQVQVLAGRALRTLNEKAKLFGGFSECRVWGYCRGCP